MTNKPGNLRVQEYRRDSKKTIWVVWSPTGDGRSYTTTLDKVPGRLVDAQRTPLTAETSTRLTVNQDPAGRLQVQVDENPLFLIFDTR